MDVYMWSGRALKPGVGKVLNWGMGCQPVGVRWTGVYEFSIPRHGVKSTGQLPLKLLLESTKAHFPIPRHLHIIEPFSPGLPPPSRLGYTLDQASLLDIKPGVPP